LRHAVEDTFAQSQPLIIDRRLKLQRVPDAFGAVDFRNSKSASSSRSFMWRRLANGMTVLTAVPSGRLPVRLRAR
jgi:hypothetical protein